MGNDNEQYCTSISLTNFDFSIFFFQGEMFLDIAMMVQGKSIFAHQLMLCAASPYFKETILNIKAPPGKYRYKPRLVNFSPHFIIKSG